MQGIVIARTRKDNEDDNNGWDRTTRAAVMMRSRAPNILN